MADAQRTERILPRPRNRFSRDAGRDAKTPAREPEHRGRRPPSGSTGLRGHLEQELPSCAPPREEEPEGPGRLATSGAAMDRCLTPYFGGTFVERTGHGVLRVDDVAI